MDFHESVPLEIINETNATVAGLKAKYGLFALEMLGSTDYEDDSVGAGANWEVLKLNHDNETGGVHGLSTWRTRQWVLDEGYTRHNVGVDENGISVKDLVTHEFGHVIHSRMSQVYKEYQQRKKVFHVDSVNEVFEEQGLMPEVEAARKWIKAVGTAKAKKFNKKVSRYAMKNDREFFAECFAMRERGEELPKYLTDAMDEVIKVAQSTLTRKPKS